MSRCIFGQYKKPTNIITTFPSELVSIDFLDLDTSLKFEFAKWLHYDQVREFRNYLLNKVEFKGPRPHHTTHGELAKLENRTLLVAL